MNHQIDVYRDLERRWRESIGIEASLVSIGSAADMLTDFFSVLMLFHTSYTFAIHRRMTELVHTSHHESFASELTPGILIWQLGSAGLLPSHKSLYSLEGEVAAPPINIDDDLAGLKPASLGFCRLMSDACRTDVVQLSEIVVVKEWKFFLAQALHRHGCARR